MTMPLFGGEDPHWTAVVELRRCRWWDARDDDLEFVRDLAAQFPTVDLAEEARQWRAYALDHPNEDKRKVRPRARFRTWVTKAREFQRSGRRRRASGAGVQRGTRASPRAGGSGRLERF